MVLLAWIAEVWESLGDGITGDEVLDVNQVWSV